MFPNAGIMAAGVPTFRSYAEFDTWVKAQTGIAEVGWSTSTAKSAGKFWAAGTGTGGSMIGSCWGAGCAATSRVSRMVQHAVNSFEHFEEVRTNGRTVFMELEAYSPSSYAALTRNSYASAAQAFFSAGVRVIDFAYWIDGVGPLRGRPRFQEDATPFNWT